MKYKICYEIDKLLPHITEYEFKNIPHIIESDCMGETNYHYHFVKCNVLRINTNLELSPGYPCIIFNDQTIKELNHYEKEMTANDNPYASPSLIVRGNTIEATDSITTWLLKYCPNINETILESSKCNLEITESVLYSETLIGYNDDLKEDIILSENDIENILSCIEDDIIKNKLKKILYAKIWKNKEHSFRKCFERPPEYEQLTIDFNSKTLQK